MKRSRIRSDPEKVRAWQQRSRKPIRRQSVRVCTGAAKYLKRSPIKPNPKRAAKTILSRFGSKEYRDHLRSRPCDVVGCGIRGCDPAHIPPRSAGGRAHNQVSACRSRIELSRSVMGHHRMIDEYPWLLPPGEKERLRELAPKLYVEFHGKLPDE